MSGFRPTRASPPLKTAILGPRAGQTSVSDISRSSAVSNSELQGLTQQDIEFLDAVIQRASPTATTFLSVFKAYNDILNERGMDPQNEVLYYGKLLKLGTLKGQSWGDKWRVVKLQQNHSGDSASRQPSTVTRDLQPPSTRITTRLTTQHQEDDLFTLHSHQDDSEIVETDTGIETVVDIHQQYHHTPSVDLRRPPSEPATTAITVLDPKSGSRSRSTAPRRQLLLPVIRNSHPWDNASDATEEVRTPSTTPPSYGAAIRDIDVYKTTSYAPWPRSYADRQLFAPAIKTVPIMSPEQKSVINEDNAWAKIKILQDEKVADRFREDRLVENCWAFWRSGFSWVVTTNEQISQARDMVLLRKSMQRWRSQTASALDLYSRVSILANNRILRTALCAWKSKLKEKRRTDWRNDMRKKMKTVREKREGTLRKDAWAKWRQSYRSHLSGQHYAECLALRFFRKWKTKLLEVDHLEAAGDKFCDRRDRRAAERCWIYWRRAGQLRSAERLVLENVGLRVMGDVMDIWKKRSHDYSAAEAFRDHYLKKMVLVSWKTAGGRITGLEKQAIKYLARRDQMIVRAIARVWKTCERGKRLEKVRALRTMKNAWITWHSCLDEQKQREGLALAFSLRSNTYIVSSALLTWRQVYASHRNALTFAVHYHSAQLRFKMLLTWRLQLRSKLQMVKQGRSAQKFLISRRAWNIWTNKLEERLRQNKLRDLERRKMRKYFFAWLQRALRDRQLKLAEQEIQYRIVKRTIKAALSIWTNRVIELKLREIEVGHRNATALLTFAFRKWKGVCVRHVEELSLMESYQDIKREENIRRMFYRWLSAARSACHRRITLQGKEDQMKAACIAVAWNKWRERFVDEKLRPVEYNVIIQSQRNTLFHAFGIWQSKTKSLPALRFHASHSKTKYWHAWCTAMPQALRASRAREMDKKAVLCKALEKWVQTYKTKIALKAIARARYLRVPTSTPRLLNPSSRIPASSGPSWSVFPRRATEAAESTAESSTAESSEAGLNRTISVSSKLFKAHTRLTNLSGPRSDTGTNAPHPKYTVLRTHEPSPTHTQSSFTAGENRSPIRARFPLKNRSRGVREPTPTRSISSFRAIRQGTAKDTDKDESPGRRSLSQPPNSTGGEMNKAKLWLELRGAQRKSTSPTERSRVWEPP